MKEDFEHIIRDIYSLDPALAKQDAEIRAVVTTLLAAKPEVVIRPEFVSELRANLLASAPTPSPAQPILGLPWYMVYLTPIGVAALLVFMLLPQQTSTLPPGSMPVSNLETEVVETAPAGDVSPKNRTASEAPGPEASSFMLMPSESSPQADPAASPMAAPPEADARMMETSMMIAEPELVLESSTRFEPFTVAVYSMQGKAGFVVVEKIVGNPAGAQKVVAVSQYLEAGFASPLTLSLREALQISVEYRVGLYHDMETGVADRGVFNPNTDTLVFEQRFTVSPDGSFVFLP